MCPFINTVWNRYIQITVFIKEPVLRNQKSKSCFLLRSLRKHTRKQKFKQTPHNPCIEAIRLLPSVKCWRQSTYVQNYINLQKLHRHFHLYHFSISLLIATYCVPVTHMCIYTTIVFWKIFQVPHPLHVFWYILW